MSDYNRDEAERLAKEFEQHTIGVRASCNCENCEASRSALKSNARSAADQLRAAVAEVERLKALSRNIHSIAWAGGKHEAEQSATADRDHLSAELAKVTEERDRWQRQWGEANDAGLEFLKQCDTAIQLRNTAISERDEARRECERLRALTLNPGATLHGSTITELAADRSLLASNLAAANEDIAKQRAAIAQMRPVYDIAIAWRDTWRHRRPFGDEALAVALVDAVDLATGVSHVPAMPTDIRADYLAAYLWLNQHDVPMFVEGKPATVAERVRLLAASRDEAIEQANAANRIVRDDYNEMKALRAERDSVIAGLRAATESVTVEAIATWLEAPCPCDAPDCESKYRAIAAAVRDGDWRMKDTHE